eukprot:5456342-Alexandrium_andersonii.AAC.1
MGANGLNRHPRGQVRRGLPQPRQRLRCKRQRAPTGALVDAHAGAPFAREGCAPRSRRPGRPTNPPRG